MTFVTVKATKLKKSKSLANWCYGFCYGGVVGKSGFKMAGVGTRQEAEDYIVGKNPECNIEFVETDGKYRAHKVAKFSASTVPTGYIMFELPIESKEQTQKYMVVDLRLTLDGTANDEQAVLVRGSLDECKKKLVALFGKGGRFNRVKSQYSYRPLGAGFTPDVVIVRC